ncbi:MAG TPA: methyltransferase domain-containing protein [Acidimicrobiia bacterium]|nr:methyltransferase domain-containing protein [Acidimicrobiia bacterium]
MVAVGLKQKTMGAVVGQFHRPHGFGGRAAGWVMAKRGSNRQRNVWAVGLLDVQPHDRALEIGFGPGVAVREFARRATSGLVVGIDHSEVMVRQARKRNAAAVRAGRVDLRLGTAERLPAFDASFDKILAVNSLMFWDDPVDRLVELRRLLRPGGRIAIAFQPRGPGASDETAAQAGLEMAEQFAAAGFTDVRVETLDLRPTNAVCVLGVRPR